MRVIDNSGARLAEVIGFYGQQGQYGYVGDVVITGDDFRYATAHPCSHW